MIGNVFTFGFTVRHKVFIYPCVRVRFFDWLMSSFFFGNFFPIAVKEFSIAKFLVVQVYRISSKKTTRVEEKQSSVPLNWKVSVALLQA